MAETLRQVTGGTVAPFAASSDEELAKPYSTRAPSSSQRAGAAGATLLPASVWQKLPKLKALIDLNAVPPLGIDGVEATDKNTERDHVRACVAYRESAVLKMKIHKKAIQELFTSNDKILDAEQVLELGRSLELSRFQNFVSA